MSSHLQEHMSSSDQDSEYPESNNGPSTGNRSSPLSNAENSGDVLLSVLIPEGHVVNPDPESKTVELLRIPHELIGLYCLKPRKWIHYLASIICGVEGELHFLGGNEDITDQDMEMGVDRGDHFIFHPPEASVFMDGRMRSRNTDAPSTRTNAVPQQVKHIYGGCPFSKTRADLCHACHIIPFAKGDKYLKCLLRSRNEPYEGVSINSNKNMLSLFSGLHDNFDRTKLVAFLKTPNEFFKTNEVPGGEDADPEEYRVTLHCFDSEEALRNTLYHGSHSNMRKGSGERTYTPERNEDENVNDRPMDCLLDLSYAYNLLVQWGSAQAKEILRKDEARYYPDGVDQEREGRVSKRSKNDDQQVAEDGRPADFYDFFFQMRCMLAGIAPEDFDEAITAEEDRLRVEEEEREAERVAMWREDIDRHPPTECGEDTEHQHSYIEDDDDEKPVSIQEALSRMPFQHTTPALITASFSSDTHSDDSLAARASELTDGKEREIDSPRRGVKRPVSHDSVAIDDDLEADNNVSRRLWSSSVQDNIA